MPTGVFKRRTAIVSHECPVCKKEYKHEKRYHNHLLNSKCSRATTATKKAEEPAAPTGLLLSLLARIEKLETSNKEKDETITKLVTDMGNLKRSLYYVRDNQNKVNEQVIESQKTANEKILKAQEALKKETQKLHHDKFWFKLHQRQTQT
jgi:hypothetical protein